MAKTAFIFPGQGAQYVGMGKEIANEFKSADNIYSKASEVLGYNVKQMIFEGDEETLKITENTQPAIMITSIACLQPLLEEGLEPYVTAGLSLGEYSAHVLSGTISFGDAVSIVRKRGKYMQEAVPLGVGAMAAVIGLSEDDVTECCSMAAEFGIVSPANYNCPGQIVVSGEVEAVRKVVELCSERGAKKAVLLPVSAPFHSSMLKPAGEKLAAELEKIKLNDMNTPVVTNVTAEYINDKTLVKDLLMKQVSTAVLWEKSVINMINDGVDTFVEIGPGKVLSGFIRRINRKVKTLNVEDIKSLNKAINELKV